MQFYSVNNTTTNYHQSPLSVATLAKTGCVLTTLYMQACDSSTTYPGPSLLVATPPPPTNTTTATTSSATYNILVARTAIAAIGNLMFRKPS